jgi:hypothetical protein
VRVNVPRDIATYTTGAGIDNPIVRLSTDRNNITFLPLYEGATIREEEEEEEVEEEEEEEEGYTNTGPTNQKLFYTTLKKAP